MDFWVFYTIKVSLGFVSMDSPLDFTPHMNFWVFLALQNMGSFQVVISGFSTTQNA